MPFKLRNINKLSFYKQMALPLKFKSIKNRENYLVSKCNVEAVKLIENSTFWQNSKKTNSIPGAIVYGPKGSGKTHLSSILKQEIDGVYLTSLSNNCLEQVTEGKNFILDNFIPGKSFPSELVMHFINQVTYDLCSGMPRLAAAYVSSSTSGPVKGLVVPKKDYREQVPPQ